MAVKIEKGGWTLIFALGLGLVGYSLHKYGVIDLSSLFGSHATKPSTAAIDPTKPLALPPSGAPEKKDVRVRVNIWVGCVGGLVANGGLDTATESIFGNKGLKVSFKIIDDWTEGSAALATNNVDIMLTTVDVWAKDFAQTSTVVSMMSTLLVASAAEPSVQSSIILNETFSPLLPKMDSVAVSRPPLATRPPTH